MYASKALDAVKEKLENFDQTVGVQILQTALRVPLKTIADNAGNPTFRVHQCDNSIIRSCCDYTPAGARELV